MNRKPFIKYLPYILMAVTAVLITAAGIFYHQAFLRILPLYISLVIGYLQSRLSRYASLLGGINSLLYAYVYFHYRLFGSMAYAILISCPIQILTFLRWRKNPWKGSTVFKRMTNKQRVLLAAGFAAVWSSLYLILSLTGSSYILFDNTVTLFGILISFLTMFAYVEYTFLMLPSSLINIGLYTAMLAANPEQSTFLIYSFYSFICQCFAFVNARKLYAEQRKAAKQTVQNASQA